MGYFYHYNSDFLFHQMAIKLLITILHQYKTSEFHSCGDSKEVRV